MTADLKLTWVEDATGADLVVENGDLALDPGLGSTALASLLTDARADVELHPDHASDLRGWWGDALDDRGVWGGLFWTLAREKALPEIQRRAEDYATDALSWLVDAGIASGVSATAIRIDGYGDGSILGLQIDLTRPDGGRAQLLYDGVWRAMEGTYELT